MMQAGKLLIVATPIGNLGDITLRALEALKNADFIAAEDTRRTVKLLNHYEIKKRMVSFHEYSDDERLRLIIGEIREGKNCALVSDAGTPVISDPGYLLIRKCVEEGIEVESLPGPCAGITAVTLSGIDCRRFLFVGFLPQKQAARKKELEKVAQAEVAAVLYESPNRVLKTLEDICSVMGPETEVCVARELTKVYEEAIRGTARAAACALEKKETVKGEFVLVVGAPAKPREMTEEEILAALRACLEKGMTKKEAVTSVTTRFGIHKNKAYRLLLNECNRHFV